MPFESSIINRFNLELLSSLSNRQDRKRLERRVKRLFKGLSKESLEFAELLTKLNSDDFTTDNLKSYTIGDRPVKIVRSKESLKIAIDILIVKENIGFDTEQRPTFKRGEKQKAISIIQMSTDEVVFIFQTKFITDLSPVLNIISDEQIRKVGFGLKNDIKELSNQYGIIPNNLFDLSTHIKTTFNLKHQMGAKRAVGIFLNRKLQKSKKAVMSNWENNRLSDNQIKYASEDVTAALDVFNKLHSLDLN